MGRLLVENIMPKWMEEEKRQNGDPIGSRKAFEEEEEAEEEELSRVENQGDNDRRPPKT